MALSKAIRRPVAVQFEICFHLPLLLVKQSVEYGSLLPLFWLPAAPHS
jgi:hypothetical protein